MKTRVVLFGFVAVLAGAASASAQLRSGTIELNPFAGYFFGGQLTHRGVYYPYPCVNPGCQGQDANVDVDDQVTYGGRVGYNFTSLLETEFQYSQTSTNFVARPFDGPDVNFGKLKIEYFMGYLTFNFGHGRLVPYFTIGAGAANLIPKVPNTFSTSEVRFTSSLGGGVKWFLTPHFGLRLDGRIYSTYLGNNSHVYCDPYGFCSSQNWLSNGDVNGGFIIAF